MADLTGASWWNKNALSGSFVDSDTPYSDLYNSNPYANSSYGKSTFWDKIGDFFGFATSKDKYERDRLQAYNQYVSNLDSTIAEYNANLPSTQAENLRAAGINPDLTGVSSYESSGVENPISSPIPSQYDNSNVVSNLAETTLRIAAALMGLQGQSIANANAAIEGFGKADSVALQGLIFRSPVVDPYSPNSIPAFNDYSSLPRQARKWMNNSLKGLSGSPALTSGIASSNEGMVKALGSLSETMGVNGYDPSQTFGEFVQYMNDFRIALGKTEKNLREINLNKDLAYAQTYDPELAANAENAGNEATMNNKNKRAAAEQPLANLLKNLAKTAGDEDAKGHFWANALLLAYDLFSSSSFSSGSVSKSGKSYSASFSPW